jgi:hypothetical protein
MATADMADERASEIAAQQNAEDVVRIANAMLAAQHGDVRRVALGLLVIAEVLIGDDDRAGRTLLAKGMLESAGKLDPHLIGAESQ